MALMRGATLVRKGIAEYLKSELPKQRAYALGQWDLDEFTLPEISRIADYPLRDIQHADTLTVSVGLGRANNFVRNDYSDRAEEQYEVRYGVRLYVALTTPDGPDGMTPDRAMAYTTTCRDDTIALIRSLLLSRPSLGQPDAFSMNENTLTEDYSDIISLKGGRFSAAGFLAFDLTVDESQYRPILGTAEEITITANQLPREG